MFLFAAPRPTSTSNKHLCASNRDARARSVRSLPPPEGLPSDGKLGYGQTCLLETMSSHCILNLFIVMDVHIRVMYIHYPISNHKSYVKAILKLLHVDDSIIIFILMTLLGTWAADPSKRPAWAMAASSPIRPNARTMSSWPAPTPCELNMAVEWGIHWRDWDWE